MKYAKLGDRVVISYIGTLDDGRIFDQATPNDPLVITLGDGEIFPALENEIIGMRPKEARNILLSAEDAYGLRTEENLLRLARSAFPPERQLTVGAALSVDFADGSSRLMRLIDVGETHVVLDGNHALAGQDLTFALQLDRILCAEENGEKCRC